MSSQGTIAELLSIFVSAVEAIIASIPDLSMWRRRMQFVERQKANREEFQQAVADLTEPTVITEFKRKHCVFQPLAAHNQLLQDELERVLALLAEHAAQNANVFERADAVLKYTR